MTSRNLTENENTYFIGHGQVFLSTHLIYISLFLITELDIVTYTTYC